MRNLRRKIISAATAAALMAGVGLTLTACTGATDAAEDTPAATAPPSADQPAAEVAPAEPELTASQQNAKAMAEQYLRTMAFSRDGLVKQLQYEGFSAEDAAFGADAQNADWDAQAVAMAKQYLAQMPFSRDGLIQQLTYEGFTQAQAEHGVTAAGL